MIDTQSTPKPPDKKKLTLMFFFASDNTLSPSTLPQLKAIKAAGPDINANVLVYFDPNEKGAPTRVFEMHRSLKLGHTPPSNGNRSGSLVSVLSSDYLCPEDIRANPGVASQQFGESLQQMHDALNADTALEQFLAFCREAYPAHHYMLFLVGHGLVVGRDAFLPDDNPDSAIGLKKLGDILRKFSADISAKQEKLQLIGMHSCSMSAIEVAYELKGTAAYMLGSQGLSFVGSWPYRQLLTAIYNGAKPENVDFEQVAKDLHTLCIHYSVDFMYAGFPSDSCLCSLESDRVSALTDPISALSNALTRGLEEPRLRELIVFAHWKSQSFWQEMYTDLYDYCLCLQRLCRSDGTHQTDQSSRNRSYDELRIAIIEACTAVINALKPQNGPVVRADYIGPASQYSHGLSIYFPWSEPLEDENDQVIRKYENYAFSQELVRGSWFDFLRTYFELTQRDDRLTEEQADGDPTYLDPDYQTVLTAVRGSFEAAVQASTNHDFFPTSALEGKVSPPDAGGGACSCASTKNYPMVFSMSPGVSTIFPRPKTKTAAAQSTSQSQSI